MSKAFDYRTGAVQAIASYDPVLGGSLLPRKFLKYCVERGELTSSNCNLSMFSPKVIKKALKRLKKDYPNQRIRFGRFNDKGLIYLAIQPERPTPPDQWMVVGQVVQA